ncbi:hypothetical protein FXO37_03980 [Capsicum annuum]|nr:hypothetical protein FXO37_03980 [Capsicum annuum]
MSKDDSIADSMGNRFEECNNIPEDFPKSDGVRKVAPEEALQNWTSTPLITRRPLCSVVIFSYLGLSRSIVSFNKCFFSNDQFGSKTCTSSPVLCPTCYFITNHSRASGAFSYSTSAMTQRSPQDTSLQSSPAREEGEVPKSKLDPDTRRRLLILQYSQDTRDQLASEPKFPLGTPLQVSVPPQVRHVVGFQLRER